MTSGELTGDRLTPRAEADLEDIWRNTAQTWSPDHADTCIDSLVHMIETRVAMPAIARARDEFDPPVRIHPAAEHLIISRVEDAFSPGFASLAVGRTGGACRGPPGAVDA